MSISQNKYSKHLFFMRLALQQAKKNLGNTKLNPSVGCVIVKNNNTILSVGSTSLNGRPHAEHNALSFSKVSLKNSSIYVTLEPCSHYGKTKPCVDLILKKKIKRVYFSVNDPDIRSFDKSTHKFKQKNILVKKNILSKEVNKFYESYFKYKRDSLPFVTSKLAISKDFFANNMKKKWITNKFSRDRVHMMRSCHDCLLTSSKTIIKDNPRLDCRINGLQNTSPSLIILDKDLKIPLNSFVIKFAKRRRTIVFFNKINKRKLIILKKNKIKVVRVDSINNGYFNLRDILLKIKLLGFSRIFLESGLKLTTNFLSEGLVDEFKLFVSNKKIKNKGNNNFKRNMNIFFKNKKLITENVNLFGDKLISCRLK